MTNAEHEAFKRLEEAIIRLGANAATHSYSHEQSARRANEAHDLYETALTELVHLKNLRRIQCEREHEEQRRQLRALVGA